MRDVTMDATRLREAICRLANKIDNVSVLHRVYMIQLRTYNIG